MCQFEPKYLEEMEARLKADIKILFERTRSDIVNPATESRLLGIKEEILIEVKKITDKLDLIYPHTVKEIERQKAYDLVKGEIKKGSGYMKWLLGILVTFGALSGYLQMGLKLFLGIK